MKDTSKNKHSRAITDLLDVMTRLRDPDTGCPWDKEQTFTTIAPYTIEEAYEVADAIASGDMDQLEDELGDLLFQVVFYAQMSREAGGFDFDDVANRIATKMRDRHPHVFGSVDERTSEGQTIAWETQKAQERDARAAKLGRKPSALDGVALALPALMRAQKLQKRAAREGFDWTDLAPVIAKIREELEEVEAEISVGSGANRLQDEAGDLIFACVNLARHLGIDAEVALRDANDKFDRRFRHVETGLEAEGKSLGEADLDEMEEHWIAAKETERNGE
jgi:nucleoside triphosphate diphosphatase